MRGKPRGRLCVRLRGIAGRASPRFSQGHAPDLPVVAVVVFDVAIEVAPPVDGDGDDDLDRDLIASYPYPPRILSPPTTGTDTSPLPRKPPLLSGVDSNAEVFDELGPDAVRRPPDAAIELRG